MKFTQPPFLCLFCICVSAAWAADAPPKIVQVAAESKHAVALRSDGTVINWGVSGTDPDLGLRGSLEGAVQVPGLSDVVQVSASGESGTALRADGTVWQWGIVSPPVVKVNAAEQVAGLAGVVALGSGFGSRNFAVKADGTVWEWMGRAAPMQLPGFSQIAQVSFWEWAGQGVLLARRYDGTVWHQGFGSYAAQTFGAQPSQVAGLSGITAVSAGSRLGAAIGGSGDLWVWGELASFQDPIVDPIRVATLSDVARVSGNVALLADGSVWLLQGTLLVNVGGASILSPIRLTGFPMISEVEVVAGSLFTLDRDNVLRILGWDRVGDVAATVPPVQTRPWRINGLSAARAVSTSPFATLALLRNGALWAWGNNHNGQIGDGNTLNRVNPVRVVGLTGVKQATLGATHALALVSDGTVWTWGSGGASGGTGLAPAIFPGLSGVASIAAGAGFSLALMGDGTVKGWGSNIGGSLGDGTTTHRDTPVTAQGIDGVVAISAQSASLALKRDGSVWQWGRGIFVPTPVSGLSDIEAIAAGSGVNLALDKLGGLWAWGGPKADYFGPGQSLAVVPAPVNTPDEVVTMAVVNHILIATRDGAVWSLGNNQWGQLGNGNYIDSNSWELVEGLRDVVSLTASPDGSAAVKSDGFVYAWGRDNDGQVGVADARFYDTPVLAGQYRSETAISMLTPATGAEGSPVLVSFDVSSWAGTPTGTIRIAEGDSVCEAAAPTGSCELIPSGTGHRSISATYLGDGTYAQSYALIDYFVTPAGSAAPKLGVFVNGAWFLDRNGDFSFDAAREMTNFGGAGDIPVRGDWNGDGFDEVGVYANGVWSIDLNGDHMLDVASEVKVWGLPGWTPAPGDWNGDGTLDLGAVSPDLVWWRDLNGDFVFDADTEATVWGSPGDTPVVADWNGDGVDDLAVYSGGLWFLDGNGDGAFDFDTEAKGWGVAGWLPLPGDWNGDGAAELGVVSPDSVWFRDINADTLFDSDSEVLVWGSPGDAPLVEDWNGDGANDVGVYSEGRWYLDRNGDGAFDPATEFDGWGEAGWTPAPGRWK